MSSIPMERIARFTTEAGKKVLVAFEQLVVVRYTHWISAVAVTILIASGIQIFFAFPSFGPKIPQHNLIHASRHRARCSQPPFWRNPPRNVLRIYCKPGSLQFADVIVNFRAGDVFGPDRRGAIDLAA